jgi:hypothetical protein
MTVLYPQQTPAASSSVPIAGSLKATAALGGLSG